MTHTKNRRCGRGGRPLTDCSVCASVREEIESERENERENEREREISTFSLGVETSKSVHKHPIEIVGLRGKKICCISIGRSHAMALSVTGQVIIWLHT